VGSLSGALACSRVTQAYKGRLSTDGNRAESIKAKAGLTARLTGRAGAKAGLSDPRMPCGRHRAYRIKVTPGITAWSVPRVHIDGPVRDLDVGSAYPGGEEAAKGWSVRPLKRYVSWVQNVVRQFGLYPQQALAI
jgi:hypothetical protein